MFILPIHEHQEQEQNSASEKSCGQPMATRIPCRSHCLRHLKLLCYYTDARRVLFPHDFSRTSTRCKRVRWGTQQIRRCCGRLCLSTIANTSCSTHKPSIWISSFRLNGTAIFPQCRAIAS